MQLLLLGLAIDSVNKDGKTALQLLIDKPFLTISEDLLSLLLSHSANPNVANSRGEKLIEITISVNRPDLTALISQKTSDTPLATSDRDQVIKAYFANQQTDQPLDSSQQQLLLKECEKILTKCNEMTICSFINDMDSETLFEAVKNTKQIELWLKAIKINMQLKEASSDEIKLEMESESLLSVGAFGGNMEGVVEKAISEIVTQFAANL